VAPFSDYILYLLPFVLKKSKTKLNIKIKIERYITIERMRCLLMIVPSLIIIFFYSRIEVNPLGNLCMYFITFCYCVNLSVLVSSVVFTVKETNMRTFMNSVIFLTKIWNLIWCFKYMIGRWLCTFDIKKRGWRCLPKLFLLLGSRNLSFQYSWSC